MGQIFLISSTLLVGDTKKRKRDSHVGNGRWLVSCSSLMIIFSPVSRILADWQLKSRPP